MGGGKRWHLERRRRRSSILLIDFLLENGREGLLQSSLLRSEGHKIHLAVQEELRTVQRMRLTDRKVNELLLLLLFLRRFAPFGRLELRRKGR